MIIEQFERSVNDNYHILLDQLKKWKEPSWLRKWARGKTINILDLGCGFPSELLCFKKLTNTGDLIGVDKDSRRRITSEYYRMREELKRVSNKFYDISKQQELGFSEKEFEAFVKKSMRFKTDMIEFLKTDDKFYDLVICSMSLHFLDRESFINCLELALKRKKEGGLFYILLQDKSINPKFPADHWSGDLDFIYSVCSNSDHQGNFHVISEYGKYFQVEFTNIGIE
jgi:hypothetical protein